MEFHLSGCKLLEKMSNVSSHKALVRNLREDAKDANVN